MMIETTVYKGADFSAGARVCIKGKLYISGWELLPTLQFLMDKPADVLYQRDVQLVVAFKGRVPVALALYDGAGKVMAFCHEDFRRQGYASACVKQLTIPNYGYACEGIEGTHVFWFKQDIDCRRYIQLSTDMRDTRSATGTSRSLSCIA